MAREKKKRRIGFFTITAVVVVTVYAAYTLVNLQLQINARKSEAVWLTAELEETKARNAALQAAIEFDLSDETIAELARDKLDFAMPGEQVFVNVSN